MSSVISCKSPGKINLCLYLGPTRQDGKHRLVTVIEPLTLADLVTVAPLDANCKEDRIECASVVGKNIALSALELFREATGLPREAQQITVEKHVPVAAGMGGGSGNAAAVLRVLSSRYGDISSQLMQELAARLGADVPSQLVTRRVVATAAGEETTPFDRVPQHSVVVVPADSGLSTGEVFQMADRIGPIRTDEQIAELTDQITTGSELTPSMMVNDLQPAAVALCPEINQRLAAANKAGCDHVMVTGSGPTVIGLTFGSDHLQRALSAVEALSRTYPRASCAQPVGSQYGQVRKVN